MLAADEIYRVSNATRLSRVPVIDVSLHSFVQATDRFTSALGQEVDSEPWQTVLRQLGRVRWQLLTLPLPADHPVLGFEAVERDVTRWAAVADGMAGPEVGAHLRDGLDALRSMISRGETPLGQATVEALSSAADARVVVRSSRFAGAVGEWAGNSGRVVSILSATEAATRGITDLLIVVGLSRWHPQHLATASRARTTTYIHHSWLRDQAAVAGTLAPLGKPFERAIEGGHTPDLARDREWADFEPEVDWAAIARPSGAGGVGDHEAPDVAARAVVLAGGLRVLLEDDPASVLFVVEPASRPGRRVRRERLSGLAAGDYLLLRTERGRDDIIRQLADGLLRDRAPALRARQARWKNALRELVRTRGFDTVLRDLARLGMKARNLRGWLLPDTIRTGTESDFLILMSYCGLGDEGRRIWTSMRSLARAHVVAGQRLRDLLEDAVESSDVEELRREGRLDVKLKFAGTGALSIMRVDAVAPETAFVPPSSLRVLEELPAELWLE